MFYLFLAALLAACVGVVFSLYRNKGRISYALPLWSLLCVVPKALRDGLRLSLTTAAWEDIVPAVLPTVAILAMTVILYLRRRPAGARK